MRDQLEKHRSNPTCYDCHRKIDPLGFAFETFDPIGRWRSNYKDKLPIDASGSLPDGSSFDSMAEFKDILLGRRDQISRAITGKLLSLASGRRMEPGDRREIDRIVSDLQAGSNGFRELIEEVILSEIFLNK